MVQEVVRGIFYFLIASGLITWLIRQIFLNYFNKDIEKFKSEIKQEQIRFSRLHEKRAEVIEELYITLADFDTKINSLISPVQWAGEHPKQAGSGK